MNPTSGHREGDLWTERLSEFLDDELPERDREAFERHLADCAACAVALAELREVRARARELEDRLPSEDLWPGIAARISAPAREARPIVLAARAPWWRRRFDLAVPQLAAAAVLLMALSAAGVWLALSRTPGRGAGSPGTTGPVAARPSVAPAGDAGPEGAAPTAASPDRGADAAAALAGYGGPGYDAAIAELERALAEGRGRLDPKTVRVLEENLRIIDRAVDEARRAVEADPGNTWLRSHLASTMRRKAELLRTATMLVASSG